MRPGAPRPTHRGLSRRTSARVLAAACPGRSKLCHRPPLGIVADVASRDAIVAHLDALLRAGDFQDYGPNGLQVPGPDEVHRIVSGVSANRALIESAAALEA